MGLCKKAFVNEERRGQSAKYGAQRGMRQGSQVEASCATSGYRGVKKLLKVTKKVKEAVWAETASFMAMNQLTGS